jgi:hypothetical protein
VAQVIAEPFQNDFPHAAGLFDRLASRLKVSNPLAGITKINAERCEGCRRG